MTYKVNNMTSSQGNTVPNQFIINHEGKEIFQSYQTVIAIKEGDTITLDADSYDYSKTTMKYLAQFLGHGIAETRKRIKSNEYALANLN